ncbi:hypothetical protein [Amycolatopsis sp. NPDC051061]|uniref:hypothetical protein n=1 Tax=Amycolatopsis sp. NPDC051061 TaxID=3155042 RepID=UPI00341EF4D3
MTMPKDSHSARRQDAKLLALLADLTYSEAIKRLDGSRGHGPALEAAHLVEEFHQVARTRAATTGESVRSAKQSVLRERDLFPADAAFPELNAESYEWTDLHGVHARCERRLGDVTQSLTGVLLPPSPGQPTHRMRSALTSPARGRQPGEVVTLDGRRWTFTPTSTHGDAADSRRTRCSAGRPVYTAPALPEEILLPLSDLRRRRLIPARTQAPIATLRPASGRLTPLYAVADAVPIPAETPRQARGIQRARTCGTCHATSETPLRMARDGRHYCAAHLGAAAERVERAEFARGRAVSTVWAREVAQDPRVVLLALIGAKDRTVTVHAEDLAGGVIVDHVFALADVPNGADVLLRQVRPEQLPAWVHDPEIRTLFSRRLLTVMTDGADDAFVSLINATDYGHRRGFGLRSEWRDRVRRRYQIWTGERRPEPGRFDIESIMNPEYLDRRARRSGGQVQKFEPAAVLAEIRTMLAEMAAEELSEAEAAHAQRYLADEPQPRTSISERRPDRAKMPTALMQVFGEKDVPSI